MTSPALADVTVGVIGSGTDPQVEVASEVGTLLAEIGVNLLTGGGQGVMASVSRAYTQASRRRGVCIGILPSASEHEPGTPKPGYPNPYVELAIHTHLPRSGAQGKDVLSRNHINVLSCAGVIALPGGAGTTSEVELALVYERPVIGYARDIASLAAFPEAAPRTTRIADVEAFVRNLCARFALVVAAVGLIAAPVRAGASTGHRVVVAWDTPAIQGRTAALDADPPYAFTTPELAVGADGLVRAALGRIYHLSRTSGVLTAIDPESWTPAQSFALGSGSEPRDVAVIDADTAYVSRRSARHLMRLDLASGAKVDAVDLAPLGAGDGNPAMETMLVWAGRLYLQLAGEPGSPQPHSIAVIDLASETLVDADPVAPGVQGIALVGTGPRFKMQRVPRSNRIVVSATGAFHDNGGFELVDLATMDSLGLVVREQEEAGADAGAFTMVDAQRGWLVFSTDLLLSSHLHAFTLTGGMDPSEADVSLDYFAPHLVYHAASNTLFWPEPDGVQPFDATNGAPRAGPTSVDGLPTDLELLAPTLGVIPVPSWAPITLCVLFAAAAFASGRRASRRG